MATTIQFINNLHGMISEARLSWPVSQRAGNSKRFFQANQACHSWYTALVLTTRKIYYITAKWRPITVHLHFEWKRSPILSKFSARRNLSQETDGARGGGLSDRHKEIPLDRTHAESTRLTATTFDLEEKHHTTIPMLKQYLFICILFWVVRSEHWKITGVYFPCKSWSSHWNWTLSARPSRPVRAR